MISDQALRWRKRSFVFVVVVVVVGGVVVVVDLD